MMETNVHNREKAMAKDRIKGKADMLNASWIHTGVKIKVLILNVFLKCKKMKGPGQR